MTTKATSSDQTQKNNTQSFSPQNASDGDTIQTPDLRNQLFKAAMSRKWKVVLELYKSNKSVRNKKITRANETVLHVAVSAAPQYIVLELLQIVQGTMSKDEWTTILGSQNKDGDTPLHLAATLGLEIVCLKMIEMCPELVTSTRNNLNETPIFMAVRHGKKKTFFVLETSIHKQQKLTTGTDIHNRDTTHCRRKDGNNILHYAIKGEHFGNASPLLIAAKTGITEMVKKILDEYPVGLLDQDENNKNVVLLAVENRHASVYKHILDIEMVNANIFRKVDKDGNSALHLAAVLSQSRPWSIPGAALQMQWERKWYKFVLNSMEQGIFAATNSEGKRAQEVFTQSHEELVKAGSKWLTNTSQSCSVVAALVATVAFASASTVPGGVDQTSGFPILGKRPAFEMFAIGSLVALCFSITSLVMFLAILTSRYEERDFERRLPIMLILGLTSLFMSIASMLVSFCAGDFFIVDKDLKLAAYPIYAVMCFPVTFFAIAQFKLYVDVIKATIKKIPERTEMEAY